MACNLWLFYFKQKANPCNVICQYVHFQCSAVGIEWHCMALHSITLQWRREWSVLPPRRAPGCTRGRYRCLRWDAQCAQCAQVCTKCPSAQCAMQNVLFVHWEFWGTALDHRTAQCAMQQMYIVIDCIGGQYRCLFPAFGCPMYNSMKHNFMCCNILTTLFVLTFDNNQYRPCNSAIVDTWVQSQHIYVEMFPS